MHHACNLYAQLVGRLAVFLMNPCIKTEKQSCFCDAICEGINISYDLLRQVAWLILNMMGS